MSIYQCCKCCKQFKQKIDYIRHTNRKRPCIEVNTINNNKIDPIEDLIIISHECTEMHNFTQHNTKMHNFTHNNDEIFGCTYCGKKFSRNYTLKRHLDDNFCKIKKLMDEQNNNKDNMIELLVKQLETKYEKQIEELKNEMQLKNLQQIEELKNINEQQIEELKQIILTLETKITKSNKKIITTTNSNNINTNSNNTNLIIQFGYG